MLDSAKTLGTDKPYLRNTNVQWFKVNSHDIKSMPLRNEELADFRLLPGDVLICEGGHGIGRTAVWDKPNAEMYFQKALHRVRPNDCLNPHFFAYCMKVFDECGYLHSLYTGAGIPHLTGKSLRTAEFPLPPKDEQDQIVRRVTSLTAICDALDEQLLHSHTCRADMSDSLIARLLAGSDRERIQ